MVWGGIFLTGKNRFVISASNLSAEGYRDEILEPVAIPYLHSLGPNSILQDDNAERNLSETTSRIRERRGRNDLPAVLTSTPLNICGIGLGVLSVPEWPTQPRCLIWNK